jgi:hypothetical protein
LDSAKLKKLQDYSIVLTQQAESKEAQGNKNEAAKDYVKLVDVLLLLANEAKDHPTWQQLISRAEFYQKKARTMVDPAQAGTTQRGSPTPNLVKQQQQEMLLERMSANPTPEQSVSASESSSSVASFNPFRKLIGRKPETKNLPENSTSFSVAGAPSTTTTTAVSSWAKDPELKSSFSPSSSGVSQHGRDPGMSTTTQANNDDNGAVPRSIYSQVLEEKAALQRQIELLKNREREYLVALEEKERQFSERISQMVPRSEFEELRSKLANTVPRSQYDEALAISAIPKERYLEIQAQLSQLESKLQNSVSRAIMDDLAEYVSFLASTVFTPMENGNPEENSYEDAEDGGEK